MRTAGWEERNCCFAIYRSQIISTVMETGLLYTSSILLFIVHYTLQYRVHYTLQYRVHYRVQYRVHYTLQYRVHHRVH